jgi:hypothetical protein
MHKFVTRFLFVPYIPSWWIYSGDRDVEKVSVARGALYRTIVAIPLIIRRVGIRLLADAWKWTPFLKFFCLALQFYLGGYIMDRGI